MEVQIVVGIISASIALPLTGVFLIPAEMAEVTMIAACAFYEGGAKRNDTSIPRELTDLLLN